MFRTREEWLEYNHGSKWWHYAIEGVKKTVYIVYELINACYKWCYCAWKGLQRGHPLIFYAVDHGNQSELKEILFDYISIYCSWKGTYLKVLLTLQLKKL